ncbi:MAG TPA: hypothetical protein VEO02_02935, partial [Thermoanaerobaculia bacterium]|nr:hypothetical protein [Thermoanaerobaculia bacterium]
MVQISGEPSLEGLAGGLERRSGKSGAPPAPLQLDGFFGGPLMVLFGALDFAQEIFLLRGQPRRPQALDLR